MPSPSQNEIDFFQLMEDRRVETEQHIEKLHIRINDMKDELHDEIEKSHNAIMSEIKELREDQRVHNNKEVVQLERLDERLKHVERWKWIVMGGGIVVGWLLLGGLDAIKDFFN